MAGWTAVLVSHGQLPDSGCRSFSLVEDLEFLDLMGVISSPCTIIVGHIRAAGASARPEKIMAA
jgi:hypothetical protein